MSIAEGTGNSMDARISRDANSSTSISRDANSTVWTSTTNEFSRKFVKNSSEMRKKSKKILFLVR
jgi:hypothetical protein